MAGKLQYQKKIFVHFIDFEKKDLYLHSINIFVLKRNYRSMSLLKAIAHRNERIEEGINYYLPLQLIGAFYIPCSRYRVSQIL